MSASSSIPEWAANHALSGIVPFAVPLYGDYLVPANSLRPGASAPNFSIFRDGLYQYNFNGSGGSVDEGHFAIHVLHDLKAGTVPTFHVHWGHNVSSGAYTAGTQSVKWQIEYSVSRGYGASTFGSSVVLSTTQLAGAQYAHHITDDDDMPLTAFQSELEPDAIILGRIFRDSGDVADTFTNPAFIFQIDLHFVRGQVGTLERNRPFTSAGFGA